MFKLFQLKLAPRLANLKTFSLLCVCSVLVSADILPLCGYRGPKQTPVAFLNLSLTLFTEALKGSKNLPIQVHVSSKLAHKICFQLASEIWNNL